jgi:hypothetical protein
MIRIYLLFAAVSLTLMCCSNDSVFKPAIQDSFELTATIVQPPPPTGTLSVAPPPTENTLPALSLKPDAGKFRYGTAIMVQPNVEDKNLFVEYSWDEGITWWIGNNPLVSQSGKLWVRTRIGTKASPIIKTTYQVFFERVLVFGNSITHHLPRPEVGWKGNWGMAATAADKDYLHLITTGLQANNKTVIVKNFNIVPFETGFEGYSLNNIDSLKAFKPDLIILRFGENVTDANVYPNNFRQAYLNLINKVNTNDHAKIICTTSCWSQPLYNQLVVSIATEKKYDILNLYDLQKDPANFAYKQFADIGVSNHPSDKGMQTIATMILDNLKL